MKHQSIAEQHMNRCKYFTGIQHDTCKKGVHFRNHVGGPDWGWATRLPCFQDKKPDAVSCEFAEFPTAEEAKQHEREVDEHFKKMFAELNEGKCPHCHQEVKQRQVGHCVYGTCGHRLYQGKVNSKFADEQAAS